MAMTCPRCEARIGVSDVNIQEGIALCRNCRQVVRASALLDEAPVVHDLRCPPGAWDTTDGLERRLGATTRSPMAFILVPFMCVWSGGSLGGIYGSQLASGHFNLGTSLFGLPFLLGSFLLGGVAAMYVAGRVEVRISGNEGTIFTGVGRLGWTRRFTFSEFSRIDEAVTATSRQGPTRSIVMEGDRRLVFGSLLNHERRYFLIQSLRPLLQGGM